MPTVLHSFPTWLPVTQTWNYNQVRYLPDDVVSHVAADDVANLDRFPIARLHTLATLPPARRLLERVLRRCRLRTARDLLIATARAVRADVHHSHFGSVGWIDLEAVRASGARHVVTFYGADVTRLPRVAPEWRERYRELFAGVDRVLCEGPHMAAEVAALGCPPEKLRVHHLGVAVDEIAFEPRALRTGEPLRVLMAAGFVEKKGLTYGIEAVGTLARSHAVELTVIGDEVADSRGRGQRAHVAAAVERAGLSGVTALLGFQPHARFFEEAHRHHVFLAPSVTASDGDTEGGAPVAIIEALATGMPVVSTTHCDIPEVVVDGECGLLAPERDVEALADRLRRVLALRDAWAAMGRAGRERVEREFDARIQAARLAEAYRDLAGGDRR